MRLQTTFAAQIALYNIFGGRGGGQVLPCPCLRAPIVACGVTLVALSGYVDGINVRPRSVLCRRYQPRRTTVPVMRRRRSSSLLQRATWSLSRLQACAARCMLPDFVSSCFGCMLTSPRLGLYVIILPCSALRAPRCRRRDFGRQRIQEQRLSRVDQLFRDELCSVDCG